MKSAARAQSREGRSFLALEKCCLLFVCYRPPLLLSSTLLRRARSCWGARLGHSSPLGLAAPSTRQSRTKTKRPGQAKPTRRRFAGRGRGCLLHSELSASLGRSLQARSASLGRSNWPLEPARPRWGARPDRAERKRTEPDRPSLLGDASLGRTTDACCTPHGDELTLCMECTGTH